MRYNKGNQGGRPRNRAVGPEVVSVGDPDVVGKFGFVVARAVNDYCGKVK